MRFGLIIGIASVVGAVALTNCFDCYINAPSILIVVGCGLGFALAAHGYEALKRALSACSPLSDTTDVASHAAVLLTLRNSFLGAGSIGTLIGLVQMLQKMEDPSAIGPALAVALLTMLYGFILAELVVAPLMDQMLIHSDPSTRADVQMAKSPLGIHLALLFVVIGIFMTLMHSMLQVQ